MKPSFLASAVFGAITAGLIPIQVQSDPAPPPPNSSAQAISPLLNGDYLVAAPGRVEPASEQIRVAAPVTGTLKELLVKEGDTVKRGQVIAQLVNDDAQANLARANADLQLQNAELQRVINGAREAERAAAAAAVDETAAVEKNTAAELSRQQALGRQSISSRATVEQAERQYAVARERHKAAMDKYALVNDPARQEDVAIAKARVESAQAARNLAQAELDKTVIRAPIDGTILRTFRHPGELVSVYLDDPILSLGDLSKLYVRADVDEADIAKLKPGLPAYVTAEAYGHQQFSGHVLRIGQVLGKKNITTDSPREKADTKVLEVLIALDMPNPLRPGLRVNAFIMQSVAEAQARATE